MKLAVFDFDSTLMDGETIDFLAAPLGLEKEVAAITERAMAGELDFFKSLVARVALLEGLPKSKVDEIMKMHGKVHLMTHNRFDLCSELIG